MENRSRAVSKLGTKVSSISNSLSATTRIRKPSNEFESSERKRCKTESTELRRNRRKILRQKQRNLIPRPKGREKERRKLLKAVCCRSPSTL